MSEPDTVEGLKLQVQELRDRAEDQADKQASSRDSIVRLRKRRDELLGTVAVMKGRIQQLERELEDERVFRHGMLTGLLAALRDANGTQERTDSRT